MSTYYPAVNSGQAEGVKCYRNRKEVEKEAAGAVKIVKVDGGWMAFDTWDDFNTWNKQQ
jgi:hypothetical protein